VAVDAAVREQVERLYRADGARLWRSVVAFSGDRVVADDAVAEAFAQLLRRGEAVRDPKAWVWRSAFRIAAGELQRRGGVSSEVGDRVVEDPEPAWGVVEALQTLSAQQRAVVVLRDYVGHSGRATAQMLGTTEASVRVQLSRARRALRKELER
jgi:RNA polymerase sigma-70 factor (ECF subfamily)